MKKIFLLFVLLFTSSTILFFNLNNNKDIDVIDEITYKEDKIEWEKYTTNEIVLNDNLKITSPGIYKLSGNLDGNVTINTEGYVKIILSNAQITNNDGPAIMIEKAEKVYIELEENTINKLVDDGTSEYDGVIYSTDDLVIDGLGTLEIEANNKDGIVSKDNIVILNGNINIISTDDGIRGKDYVDIINGNINITSTGDGIKTTNNTDLNVGYVFIANGTINIESQKDGIVAEGDIKIENGIFNIKTGSGSSVTSKDSIMWNRFSLNNTETVSKKAIKARSNIKIENGTFNINSEDDSIHSNSNIEIDDGIFELSSGDDGIHADTSLIINNGKIIIDKSYEGLESSKITINDGVINVTTSDDGINVGGGNDQSAVNRPGANNYTNNSSYLLTINNGNIYIDSTGDGLDSNGKIIMNNGTVLVDGPTDNGNGALDYGNEFIINGGILVAVGSSGMAESTSDNSKQNSVLINFSSSFNANTIINIENIITYCPSKKYSSIVVSTPDIELNKSYDINVGGTANGELMNGLYINETYENGNLYQTYIQSSIATKVGSFNNMGGMPSEGGNPHGRRR